MAKRGVKKGIKRGPYKKSKLVIELEKDIENEFKKTEQHKGNDNVQPDKEIANEKPISSKEKGNSKGVQTLNNTSNEASQENPPAKPPVNGFKTSGSELFNKFKSEYGHNPAEEIKDESTVDVKPLDSSKPVDQTQAIPNSPINQLRQDSKGLVNGYMLLALCDVAIPEAIKFIYGFIDERSKKVKISECKLDSDQRASIMAAADIAAEYILSQMNPLLLFGIFTGSYYYQNFKAQLEEMPIIEKPASKKFKYKLKKKKK